MRRVGQCQVVRVQHQSRKSCRCITLVQRVAQDGMAQRQQVHPQLVGSAGDGLQCHTGRIGQSVQHLPSRGAGFTYLPVHFAARAVGPVHDEGQVDLAPFLFGR